MDVQRLLDACADVDAGVWIPTDDDVALALHMLGQSGEHGEDLTECLTGDLPSGLIPMVLPTILATTPTAGAPGRYRACVETLAHELEGTEPAHTLPLVDCALVLAEAVATDVEATARARQQVAGYLRVMVAGPLRSASRMIREAGHRPGTDPRGRLTVLCADQDARLLAARLRGLDGVTVRLRQPRRRPILRNPPHG